MTEADMLQELKGIIETATKRQFSALSVDSNLQEMGLESLDRIRIVIAVEQRFGVEFSEGAAAGIRTVGEMLAFIMQEMPS